jgi:phosphatidylserine/phosphatidylglycerophosphate/cardiolipin synthase-like enzyme
VAKPRDGFTATTRAARSKPIQVVANTDYAPAAMKLLDSATKSVDLVEYNFFSESGDARALRDKLISLKKDKPDLQIRLFIEGDHGDGAKRNLATVKALQAAGIEVKLDSKNLVTHAKGICVDGARVLAGSTNLTNTSMGQNNEVSLQFDSRAIGKQFEAYFEQLEAAPAELHSSTTQIGHVKMVTDGDYKAQLLDTIATAQHTLHASMYDLDFSGRDPAAKEVADALVAAAKRGVKVTLMLEQSSGTFAPDITKHNEEAYAFLKANGVDVHLDKPDQISHQKFIVGDGRDVLLGSTNWTQSDFEKRHQLNWRIDEKKLGARLVSLLNSEIKQDDSQPI